MDVRIRQDRSPKTPSPSAVKVIRKSGSGNSGRIYSGLRRHQACGAVCWDLSAGSTRLELALQFRLFRSGSVGGIPGDLIAETRISDNCKVG